MERPDCELPAGFFHWENLPNSAELLQDDNCLRFLASLKSKVVDLGVVDAITRRGSEGVSAAKVRQPTVFSTSTNASIAVSDGLWKTGAECLSNRKVMENVMIRFTLEDKDDPVFLCMDWVEGYAVWMSQAPGIFHGYGVSLDDDLSQYELIVPHLDLRGPLLNSGIKCQGRREKRIYLFVRPLSTSTPTENCTTSYFHYWSSDPTGQHPLTPEICKDLGLPVELSAEVWPTERYHWDNEPYKWMQQYQVARGFDLKTTDFAQHLGFPTYQVQRDSDRFEDLSLTNRRNREGFWSKWSWAVSEGSDIPAFGM
ncbi:hypothetical protein V5O48_009157 [Marasmius crinis-equi]|uniref:Uncharacterized protein n=1 Tax=Marasmius crinis-equi TaxID=585013 RepID=A0ABR3FCJ6_9AGAR